MTLVRPWRSLSLRWQLTVVVAGVIVLALAALGLFLDLRLSAYVESSGGSYLHQIADPIVLREVTHPPEKKADAAGKKPAPPASDVIQGGVNLTRLARDLRAELGGPESFAQVTTPSGVVVPVPSPEDSVSAAEPAVPAPLVARAVAQRREVRTIVEMGSARYLVLVDPLVANGQLVGTLALGVSLARGDALLSALRLTFLLGGLVVAVVTGLLAGVLVGLALRPLRRVVSATRRVAAGDMGARVGASASITGENELIQLGQAFDRMVERLEEAFAAQRRFVADASHELRSPLTAVGGMIEMLELGADGGDPATRQRIQRSLIREVDRMGRLVADLLTLSRIDRAPPRLEPLRLDAVVEDLRAPLEVLAREHLLAIQVGPVPPIVGSADLLAQVVINLVENATKYTPAGGRIDVGVGVDEGWVYLRVADSGSGVSPDAIPRIFERFYRADTSRSRASGGFGLGLAIVGAIVAAHGGTVGVESAVGVGTVFTVRFPVIADAHAPTVGPFGSARNPALPAPKLLPR